VVAVRDHIDRLGDATIAVITFAAVERLAAYREHLQLPFDVVADPQLSLYAILGAGRGTSRQVWSPGTLALYVRLLRAGRRPSRPTEDVRQLGADAVIDRNGILRYLSLPATPDARPPISALIDAVERTRSRPDW
jgi:AhpC/TSA antioxidant enzyme